MSSSAATTSVEGVMIEGITPRCHVLDTGHGRYALVGGDTSLLAEGARVRVTGEHHPELINRCGRTFLVHQVTAIG